MAKTVRDAYSVGDFVDSVVSFVEGPHKFYVQPLSCGNELRSLTKRLYVMFGSNVLDESDMAMTLDHLATSMRVDPITWCAAPFKLSGTDLNGHPYPIYYHRAAVIGRVTASTVKVFFVDYGNTSTVAIAELKTLSKSLQEIPIMAIPCRLVEGNTDNGYTIDPNSFRTVTDGFHMVVHVKDNQVSPEPKPPNLIDPMWVSLFVTDGKEEANVGDTLLTDLAGGTF